MSEWQQPKHLMMDEIRTIANEMMCKVELVRALARNHAVPKATFDAYTLATQIQDQYKPTADISAVGAKRCLQATHCLRDKIMMLIRPWHDRIVVWSSSKERTTLSVEKGLIMCRERITGEGNQLTGSTAFTWPNYFAGFMNSLLFMRLHGVPVGTMAARAMTIGWRTIRRIATETPSDLGDSILMDGARAMRALLFCEDRQGVMFQGALMNYKHNTNEFSELLSVGGREYILMRDFHRACASGRVSTVRAMMCVISGMHHIDKSIQYVHDFAGNSSKEASHPQWKICNWPVVALMARQNNFPELEKRALKYAGKSPELSVYTDTKPDTITTITITTDPDTEPISANP